MTSGSATVAPVTTTETFSTWNIDASHSSAAFQVRHMMISNVKGKSTEISGILKLDETDYKGESNGNDHRN